MGDGGEIVLQAVGALSSLRVIWQCLILLHIWPPLSDQRARGVVDDSLLVEAPSGSFRASYSTFPFYPHPCTLTPRTHIVVSPLLSFALTIIYSFEYYLSYRT